MSAAVRRIRGLTLAALLASAATALLAPGLALASDGNLTFDVNDAVTGQGINGVTVTVLNQGTPFIIGTTTGGGVFEAPQVTVGNYTADLDGGALGYGGLTGIPITVNAGGDNQYTETLQPDAISGQVTEDITGTPLGGISVQLLQGGTQVATTTTAASGDYGFSPVPPGEYQVIFNPSNANAGYSTAASPPQTVSAGQTTTVDGNLFAGGVIEGEVTSAATNASLSGVEVEAVSATTGDSTSTYTNSSGAYFLQGLTSGTYDVLFLPQGGNYLYQYYPGAADSLTAQPVSVTSGNAAGPIDASLAAGGTISGTVTAGGAPAAGVSVDLDGYGGSYLQFVYTVQTTTAADGTYSFSGLPSGTYEVEFSPSGNLAPQFYNGVSTDGLPTPVAVTAPNPTTGIDATLSAGAAIAGRVTDAGTDQPVAGVGVEVDDSSGNEWGFASTAADGTYKVPGLTGGVSYRVLFAPAPPYAAEWYPAAESLQVATPVAVADGQTTTNVNAALRQAGTISGTVTDAATGDPIDDPDVELLDAAGNPLNIFDEQSFEDGTYELTGLLPGTYKVMFPGDGVLATQYFNDSPTLAGAAAVTVTGGATTGAIDAALAAGGELTGTVTVAATGAPVAYIEVIVFDAAGDAVAAGQTGVNGQYTIGGIVPGSYDVEFEPEAFSEMSLEFQPAFYGGSLTLAGSTPVSISTGSTTSGINAALLPLGAPSPTETVTATTTVTTTTPVTTTVTTTTPPAAPTATTATTATKTPPPLLYDAAIGGLGKGKPSIRFRLASGANGGPPLTAFTIKLPNGLSFNPKGLARGLKVSGGGQITTDLSSRGLLVVLSAPSGAVSVSLSATAVKVSSGLSSKAKRGKAGTLTLVVTPTSGSATTLKLIVGKIT